jgi:hypothetical protein
MAMPKPAAVAQAIKNSNALVSIYSLPPLVYYFSGLLPFHPLTALNTEY